MFILNNPIVTKIIDVKEDFVYPINRKIFEIITEEKDNNKESILKVLTNLEDKEKAKSLENELSNIIIELAKIK